MYIKTTLDEFVGGKHTQHRIVNWFWFCRMWWTITGNFGNILPIDWSKSYARKLQIDSLHLEQVGLFVSDEANKKKRFGF